MAKKRRKLNKEMEKDISTGKQTVELINAKINLAEAERNYLLAQYRLLKSAGLLNSEYLKLR